MNILITNQVNTSVDLPLSNLFGKPDFNTNEMLVNGEIYAELRFYSSEASHDSCGDKIYPVVNGNKVTNCTFQVLATDVIKESGQSTMADVVTLFYGKLKAALESTYGWTITIQ